MVLLPPAVANAVAQECLDGLMEAFHENDNPFLSVERAYRRCKLCEVYYETHQVTKEEFGQHQVFWLQCVLMAAGLVAVVGNGGEDPPQPQLVVSDITAAAVVASHNFVLDRIERLVEKIEGMTARQSFHSVVVANETPNDPVPQGISPLPQEKKDGDDA